MKSALNFFLDNSSEPSEKNQMLKMAFKSACDNDQTHIAKFLLAQNVLMIMSQKSKNKLLFIPSINGSVAILKLLLMHGLDVNGPFVRSTPLHETFIYNRPEITNLLLANGANPNDKGSLGLLPGGMTHLITSDYCVTALIKNKRKEIELTVFENSRLRQFASKHGRNAGLAMSLSGLSSIVAAILGFTAIVTMPLAACVVLAAVGATAVVVGVGLLSYSLWAKRRYPSNLVHAPREIQPEDEMQLETI